MIDFPPSILLKLESYFGEKGILTTKYGLKPRRSQQQMMATICTALGQGKGALVEAGTGTGKTFAYLLPAAEFISHMQIRGCKPRVVISTASRNLQDQLSTKDFPVITSLYPHIKAFTWKGAPNYLCLNRLAKLASRKTVLSDEAANLWARREDLESAIEGTRDELPFPVTDDLWAEICGTTPACCKPDAVYACYKRRAFYNAKQADILCVNHIFLAFMVLYAHLLHPAQPEPNETLLILDEGHELLNQIRNALNKDFNVHTLTRLINQLNVEHKWKLKEELTSIVDALGVLVGDEPVHVQETHTDIVFQLKKLGRLMHSLGEEIKKDFEWQESQEFFVDVKDKEDAKAVFTSLLQHGQELDAYIANFPEDCMLEVGKNRKSKQLKLSFYPFTYERELQQLYAFSTIPPIITSATLINGTKEQALARFHLPSTNMEVNQIEGEFDYYNTVRAFHFPKITEVNDVATITHWLKLILPYSHGNALVLFTSYEIMDEVFLNVQEWGQALGYSMLTQSSEASVQELVSRMKTEHNCVLFGNSALWTGVDVKGINLSSLIIAKLPFKMMDNFAEAYSEYLEARNLSPFYEWMLPEMINRLRQGMGRLKRDENDRGLLFLLDPRFTTASYKPYVFTKLPPCRWRAINTEADLPDLEATRTWLGVTAPGTEVTPPKEVASDDPF